MAEVDQTYTDRQAALIKGEIQPETNGEWTYIQEHASDVLPGTDDPPNFVKKLEQTKEISAGRRPWYGSTQAAHISEALDAKD